MKHRDINDKILRGATIAILVLALGILALACATPTRADGRTYTAEEADILARCVWGEYRGEDTDQVAAVIWCVLNRVDDARFPNDIKSVITAPYQFSGYQPGNPIDPRIQRICYDVLARWQAETQCCGSIGRVLPPEYVYFHGNGRVNLYRAEYNSRDYWTWEWDSPYEGAVAE